MNLLQKIITLSTLIHLFIILFLSTKITFAQSVESFWDDDIVVEDGACETITRLFREDDEGDEFECHILKLSNGEGTLSGRNIIVQNWQINIDEPVYVIPNRHISGYEFSLETQETGFISLESLIRGNDCSLHLQKVTSDSGEEYFGWSDMMLVKSGTIKFRGIVYDSNAGDNSCVLSVKPHFTTISEAAAKLYVGPFSKGEASSASAERSMNFTIDLRQFLAERNYGDIINLASLKVLLLNNPKGGDNVLEKIVLSEMCDSHMLEISSLEMTEFERYSKTLFGEYLSHSYNKQIQHNPRANWLPDLRTIELRAAIYRLGQSAGLYETDGVEYFLPPNNEICFGGHTGSENRVSKSMQSIAVSFEFLSDDRVQFAQNFSSSDITTQILIDIRRFFRNSQNDGDVEILASVLRHLDFMCPGPLEFFHMAAFGQPSSPYLIHDGEWCLVASAGAKRFLKARIVGEPLTSVNLSYPQTAEIPNHNINKALLTALKELGAIQEGELTILDDLDPSYTEVQLVGDKGRVIASSPAWESSFISVSLVSGTRLIVRVETKLASRAGNVAPTSASTYKISADKNYSTDVKLFAEKLANTIVEVIDG